MCSIRLRGRNWISKELKLGGKEKKVNEFEREREREPGVRCLCLCMFYSRTRKKKRIGLCVCVALAWHFTLLFHMKHSLFQLLLTSNFQGQSRSCVLVYFVFSLFTFISFSFFLSFGYFSFLFFNFASLFLITVLACVTHFHFFCLSL